MVCNEPSKCEVKNPDNSIDKTVPITPLFTAPSTPAVVSFSSPVVNLSFLLHFCFRYKIILFSN
jgi:hypothetical protein